MEATPIDTDYVIAAAAVLALIFSIVSFCLSRRETQKLRDEMRRKVTTGFILLCTAIKSARGKIWTGPLQGSSLHCLRS